MQHPIPLKVVTMNGKKYRCLQAPEQIYGGVWEFDYKGTWHRVLNYQIKCALNRFTGFFASPSPTAA